MITDPISDCLTRIRNASRAGHLEVAIPHSRFKESLVNLLLREGFVAGVSVVGSTKKLLKVTLRYAPDGTSVLTQLKRVSSPGQRIYVPFDKIPKVRGGFGMTIVSTSKGLLTDREAKSQKMGGEVVCQVW